MILTRLKQIKSLVLLKVFSFICLFLPKSNYWVISERGTDARDNGWHFYNFIKTQHPEQKVYYIIDKSSADYEKVKADAIQYNSIKNYWVAARAEKIISTHIGMFVPYVVGKPLKLLKSYQNKFYFLQHGISYNNLVFLHKKNFSTKLFACVAKPEQEYAKSVYGHEDEVVKLVGFARYDRLTKGYSKRQILLMPTWRKDVSNEKDFLNSEYYKQWQGLIDNRKLIALLEENELQLVFYPHYEVQKYIKHFVSSSQAIKIASFADYDVQTLLKESCLLVTDYSSVFFDFAYMEKPVIYFQFDYDKFFGNQSTVPGYFDFKKDGFGRVCNTCDETVAEIETCIHNNFIPEEYYLKRIEEFFPLRDNNNCQRIFDAIESI